MNNTSKVILSNTLDDASSAWPNSSVARGDGAAAVEELKRLPGRALVLFGGVQTVGGVAA